MNPYLSFVLIVLIGSYLLGILVDILNMKVQPNELPEEFDGFYDSQKYKKSQKYLKANTRLGIMMDTVTTTRHQKLESSGVLTLELFVFACFPRKGSISA